MEKIMQSKERIMRAVAWLYGVPGRTQTMSADKFGLSQSAISTERAKQERAIKHCEENEAEVVKINKFRISNPTCKDAGVIATGVGMYTQEVVRVLYAIRCLEMRTEAKENAPYTVIDPVQTRRDRRVGELDMQRRCASLMRLIAGEHGEAMAQAIEAL